MKNYSFTVILLIVFCLGLLACNWWSSSVLRKQVKEKNELVVNINEKKFFSLQMIEKILVDQDFPIPEALLFYLPKGGCSQCVEKLFLELEGRNLLNKTILYVGDEIWIPTIEYVNNIYHGVLKYDIGKPIFEEGNDKMVYVCFKKEKPYDIGFLDIDYLGRMLDGIKEANKDLFEDDGELN
ncbi:MAG: hypothetical protein ACEPOZ_00550 [Marinifilaceae bacterium]